MNREPIRGLEWWAHTLAGADPRRWDEEVQAVNNLQPDHVPDWAWQVLRDFPGREFELCNQNWTAGLEECVSAIRARAERRRSYGSCGDVHPAVRLSVEGWYFSLRSWLEDVPLSDALFRAQTSYRDPDLTETVARVYGTLRPGPEQRDAVAILVELLGLALRGRYRELAERRQELRAQAESPFLTLLLDKLVVFETWCSYRFLQDLQEIVEAVAHPEYAEAVLANVLPCPQNLRMVMANDPGRLEKTLAYLLGVYAWLEDWPLERLDVLAPAQAFIASRIPGRLGRADPVSRWLAAAFVKTVKLWMEWTLKTLEGAPLSSLDRQRLARIRALMEDVRLSPGSMASRFSW